MSFKTRYQTIRDNLKSNVDLQTCLKAGKLTSFWGNGIFSILLFCWLATGLFVKTAVNAAEAVIFFPLFYGACAYILSLPYIFFGSIVSYFIYRYVIKPIPSEIVRFLLFSCGSMLVGYGLCRLTDIIFETDIFSLYLIFFGVGYAFIYSVIFFYLDRKNRLSLVQSADKT